MKLFAVSVSHRHGFGCLGIAKTQSEAQALIEYWSEEFDDTDDEFDISEIEIDPALLLEAAWVMPHGWSDLFRQRNLPQLEGDVVPAFLPRQRWFAGKDQRIRAASENARSMIAWIKCRLLGSHTWGPDVKTENTARDGQLCTVCGISVWRKPGTPTTT